MTKDQLRKEYKIMRNRLSISETSTLNDQIFENLISMDWTKYAYVHVYLTLQKFNEPDTARFIRWMTDYHPTIKLVVSKSDFQKGEMINYLLNTETQLVESKWGVLEPVNGELIDENIIDLVLVPLLVVDNDGNRVGYGRGFYDRFLKKCRADVQSYGLSFFEPISIISDVGEWDFRLSGCITPTKIYIFK